jgi:hypothetical protein
LKDPHQIRACTVGFNVEKSASSTQKSGTIDVFNESLERGRYVVKRISWEPHSNGETKIQYAHMHLYLLVFVPDFLQIHWIKNPVSGHK